MKSPSLSDHGCHKGLGLAAAAALSCGGGTRLGSWLAIGPFAQQTGLSRSLKLGKLSNSTVRHLSRAKESSSRIDSTRRMELLLVDNKNRGSTNHVITTCEMQIQFRKKRTFDVNRGNLQVPLKTNKNTYARTKDDTQKPEGQTVTSRLGRRTEKRRGPSHLALHLE